MSVYTSMPWPALCDEVSKLKVELREGALIAMPTTASLQREKQARNRWRKASHSKSGNSAEAEGVSPLHGVRRMLSPTSSIVVTPMGLEPMLPA